VQSTFDISLQCHIKCHVGANDFFVASFFHFAKKLFSRKNIMSQISRLKKLSKNKKNQFSFQNSPQLLAI
jgi:hypothetical protein